MEDELRKAAKILADGGLVALPTETVYGLGADACNETAVARIFVVKGRPQFNPLIVHAVDLEGAEKIGVFGPVERQLAAAFWPGPLTIVVPLSAERGEEKAEISPLVTAGLSAIAIRVPAHPVMGLLLRLSGLYIAAPSANISGRVSPTSAAHVIADIGDKVDLVIDGGETSEGIESTIVKVVSGVDGGNELLLLRPGTITAAQLSEVSGLKVRGLKFRNDEGVSLPEALLSKASLPEAPGALLKHYAPKADVRLNADEINSGEGVLGFGPEAETGPLSNLGPVFNLSETGDLREAAHRLYAGLHYMDEQGVGMIAVRPIPMEGIGLAINDRLRRAAQN